MRLAIELLVFFFFLIICPNGEMTKCQIIVAVNVTGNHVPPMLGFPKVQFKNQILTGVLTASIRGAIPTGW